MDNGRPETLNQFVGQEHAVAVLRVLLASAKSRSAPVPHLLMAGPPGLGKTTIARIVAKETGGRLVEAVGGTVKSPSDVAALLGGLKPMDTLFVDEIHALPRAVEELFYGAMEDGVLTVEDRSCDRMFKDLGLAAPKSRAKTARQLPSFTMIGATTLLGSVSAPLRTRFSATLNLRQYTLPEMAAIAQRAAAHLKLQMPEEVAVEVARRSKGTARIAVGHISWLRDYSLANGCPLTPRAAHEAFAMKGVDEHGMTHGDRAYLGRLASSPEPMGVEALAATLGESSETLLGAVEPFLMAEGLVERTPRGRMATAKGRALMEVAA